MLISGSCVLTVLHEEEIEQSLGVPDPRIEPEYDGDPQDQGQNLVLDPDPDRGHVPGRENEGFPTGRDLVHQNHQEDHGEQL